MSLNCRPGDRAVFVRPVSAHITSTDERVVIVRPGTLTTVDQIECEGVWLLRDPIHFDVATSFGSFSGDLVSISDTCLRPIRDQPGADETLTWKPVPQPVPEKEQA